jgi:hypothetical protein
MNIEKKFIELTSHTYPHGTEDKLFNMLPKKLKLDEFGNLFIKIGNSDVMFTSHLDTATSANCPVNHVITNLNNTRMIETDGKSILGADCKAGVVIMLYMIENKIPGLYYFFLGEEVGCVGSKKVANKHTTDPIPGITKVVSFDRRGTDSVITYQSNGRCCSDEFAEELAKELNNNDNTFNYKIDPTGVYTDSAQFIRVYPECTNISVGYYSEHTYRERQDITHLIKLAEACTKVNWTSLPVKRDKTVVDYGSSYGYGNYYSRGYSGYTGYGKSRSIDGWNDEYDDWYNTAYGEYPKTIKAVPQDIKEFFHDEEFNFVSYYVKDGVTKKYKSVDLSPERRSLEIDIICQFFKDIDLEYSSFSWDGVLLNVNYDDDRGSTTATREDMIEFFIEFDLERLINGKGRIHKLTETPVR